MPTVGFLEVLGLLICLLVFVVPTWKIFSKAGFPGPLALTLFLPIVNVAVLFYVAFSKWPEKDRGRGAV